MSGRLMATRERGRLVGWEPEMPYWRREYRQIIDRINRATDREIEEALRKRLTPIAAERQEG